MKKFVIYIFIILAFAMSVIAQNDNNDESAFKFGFMERVRFVTWDNAIDLSDATDTANTFMRIRTNLSLLWTPAEEIELYGKITNEFRSYFVPDDREFTINELFIDNLYLKMKKAFGLPLTLTIGRQNIILDEGFVVMDASPLDGSRSIYFNAARVDLEIGTDHNLTLFYSYEPVTDTYLLVLNDQDQALIEQPEEGIGFYLRSKFGKNNLSAYYIRKNIYIEDGGSGEESGIDTFGLRGNISLSDSFSFTTEAALQTGWRGNIDRSAFGGYFHADYKTGQFGFLPSIITVGGILLSGDDPDTSEYEAWDPLFSRWPKWSESYIYTLVKESGVAYWSNLASIYVKADLNICDEINLNLTYNFLFAPEQSDPELAFPGGDGTNRGNLFQAKLNFKITDDLRGHILWEAFDPGDYYFPKADGYNWFRTELSYTLK
ncbi:MAG: alginate export family protein [Acidobacteria bacterium]|nr:alginate export family protein [Acidobacteriota bacterium]